MRNHDQLDSGSVFTAVKKEITADTPKLAFHYTAELPETAQPAQLPSFLDRFGKMHGALYCPCSLKPSSGTSTCHILSPA